MSSRSLIVTLGTIVTLVLAACRTAPRPTATPNDSRQLPTGVRLDPVGQFSVLGSMPLSMIATPDGAHAIVLLGGWREQGIQVVETQTGRVTQTLLQPAAFVGLAFSPDGRTLYVAGGDADAVYRYAWNGNTATLTDSLIIAVRRPRSQGTRYPAGIALTPDGRTLYVAENLADSLAVVDVASGRIRQRVPTGKYPYGVVVTPAGRVFVSVWGASTVAAFAPGADGQLVEQTPLRVARHPSAMLLNRDGSKLFIASGSTDRVAVVDTHTDSLIDDLHDTPPGGPGEGSTPNALALSRDGSRLFVAEADNNAVAIFDLGSRVTGASAVFAGGSRLAGRIPVGWYPTAVMATDDQLLVVEGKGRGTGPNPDGPTPAKARQPGQRSYTLGQTTGTLSRVPVAELDADALARHSATVATLDHWTVARDSAPAYPPFQHVIYIIKENRTYDQVYSDIPSGDGDTTLLFFPRHVSPNHHAIAERFGLFDRFFCNAEVSPDGHNWSTAAYVTDYAEKTIPSQYSNRRQPYDYEGTNRGRSMADSGADDVSEPANGYLWDLAQRAGISFRNYGEFVARDFSRGRAADGEALYTGNKPFLKTHTNPRYPGFDVGIPDQDRVAVWLDEFAGYVRDGNLPALEIVRLPNDHTSGATAGRPTPWAYMADNDLALGRMIEALSASPFWKNTVVFVLEDDAQNGPDHVDSHRAPFEVISAYNRPGVYHRWTNTTDVIATIGEILHLGRLSQFDAFGRPLRDVFAATPDTTRYHALQPDVPLTARNPGGTREARESRRLDFSAEDRADEDLFNRVLWRAIKGDAVGYPGTTRLSGLELRRSR